MCILTVEVQINCVQSWWSWEASQALHLWSFQMCHTFGRGISCCYHFLLEDMSFIPDKRLCEVYVVKVWEGMV